MVWIHKSTVQIEKKCLLPEDFAGSNFLFMLFGHLLLYSFYFPQLFLCLLSFCEHFRENKYAAFVNIIIDVFAELYFAYWHFTFVEKNF